MNETAQQQTGLSTEAIVTETSSFVRRRLGMTDLDPDLDMFAAGLINSLFAVELVAHIEQAYGFEIRSDDLDPANFASVNAVAALVARRTPSHAAH